MQRQRKFSAVYAQRRWLNVTEAAHGHDALHPDAHVPHREATRHVATSQPGSGAWLDSAQDGSYATTITTPVFVVGMQRRLGLNISCASAAYDAMEASGRTPDGKPRGTRNGDWLCNSGEHSRRHHAVNNAGFDAVSATATAAVIKGDKGDENRTKQFNDGYVVDFAAVGATDSGADICYETKTKSALKQTDAKGGHLFAFGNTEEQMRVKILGCRGRGRPTDGPFNPRTGKGHVKPVKGVKGHIRCLRRVPRETSPAGAPTDGTPPRRTLARWKPHDRACVDAAARRRSARAWL